MPFVHWGRGGTSGLCKALQIVFSLWVPRAEGRQRVSLLGETQSLFGIGCPANIEVENGLKI